MEIISKVLVQIGFKKQRMCLGLFTLQSPAGILSGVICLHVDDVLGTGDGLFELTKVRSLPKAVSETCRWRNYDSLEGIHPELEES